METKDIKSFSQIIGQSVAVEYLRRVIKRETHSHAYIFSGHIGVGRKTTALAFAMAINCLNPSQGEGCGNCQVCRQMKEGTFTHIHFLEPEGQYIKISQMRELIRKMEFKTAPGIYRIIIIDRAEFMNPESANSFLKTLEEPYPWNIIILIVSDTGSVLPTILSRCQKLNFHPIPIPKLVKWIVDEFHLDQEDARIIAMNSEGSIGRAVELIQGGFLERRHEHLLKLMKIMDLSNDKLLDFVHLLSIDYKKSVGGTGPSSSGGLFELLHVWKSWFRDLVAVNLGTGDNVLINADYSRKLNNIAKNHKIDRLIRCFELIEQLQRDIMGSRNLEIAMGNAFLNLKQIYRIKEKGL